MSDTKHICSRCGGDKKIIRVIDCPDCNGAGKKLGKEVKNPMTCDLAEHGLDYPVDKKWGCTNLMMFCKHRSTDRPAICGKSNNSYCEYKDILVGALKKSTTEIKDGENIKINDVKKFEEGIKQMNEQTDKVELQYMVDPIELQRVAYVPSAKYVKIVDPETSWMVGILGESGRKLVKRGIAFYFEGKLADKLISKGIAVEIKKNKEEEK